MQLRNWFTRYIRKLYSLYLQVRVNLARANMRYCKTDTKAYHNIKFIRVGLPALSLWNSHSRHVGIIHSWKFKELGPSPAQQKANSFLTQLLGILGELSRYCDGLNGRGSISGRPKIIFFRSFQTGSEAHSAFYPMGTEDSFHS
jgi:hypothetical protein